MKPIYFLLMLLMLLLFLALTLGVPAFAAAPSETLDSLLAQRLSRDARLVRLVEPKRLRLHAVVQTLPRQGKTAYLLENLEMRGIRPIPEVGHKMMLRSLKGASAMTYVEDRVAARMLRELEVNQAVVVSATHLWDSRHGPGLLVTDYSPAAALERGR